MSQAEFKEQEYNTDSLDFSLWKKIIGMLGTRKKNLYILFIFNVLLAGCDVFRPVMDKYALDYFATADTINGNEVIWYGIAYFLFAAFSGMLVFLFARQSGRIETGFSYDIRKRAFAHLQQLSYSYYDKTPTGWIMARITSDVQRLADILAWSLMDFIWGFSTMIGATAVMLYVDWKLALIVLAVVPILAYISVWFQIRILKNYREVRKINSTITSAFSESISGAKTTKTLVLEESNFKEFKEKTGNMRHHSIRAAIFSSTFMPIVIGLSAISTAFILWDGGNKVILQVMQFGTLLMFTEYATQFFEPLKQIARLMAELQLAQASAERIISLLETPVDIVDTPEVIEQYGTTLEPKTENYPPLYGDIEFSHVDFYYNEKEPVLKNFNLKVKKGQTVALVGQTGSGKSTIVNLLCRFYQPVSGEIKIDGVDYRQRSLGWLHSNLGYVLQEPHLFSGTVRENIRYGKLDATDEQIIAAAKLVDADSFIKKLDKGYDTEVGEGGSRLSTGEKQLISFARAVVADPALFILDEATSSIDTETEKVIQNAITSILKGRTSFVVAHRLSTIVNSDIILVIKNGRIVEKGTHKDLMKKKGAYYRLYTTQFNEQLQNELLGTSDRLD